MKTLRALLLPLLLLPACVPADPPAVSSAPDNPYADVEVQILELVNRERTGLRLVPLSADPVLSEIARDHSRAMAHGARPFGHDEFRGRARLARAQIPASRGVSENVAVNALDRSSAAPHVVQQWMRSPDHRDAVLDGGHAVTGIGVSRARNGEFFYTQIFVERGGRPVARR